MPVLPIVQRLPDEYLTLIGEAVTTWAALEYELRITVFMLVGLDPKRGRVAVRSARSKDTVEMINDLMKLSGLKSKTTNLAEFGKLLDEIENRRNTLAHNVWFKGDNDVYYVQSLAGVWPERSPHGRTKRRVDPAGIPVTLETLTDLVTALRKMIEQTKRLRMEVASQLAAKKLPLSYPEVGGDVA